MRSLSTVQGTATLEFDGGEFLVGFDGGKMGEIAMMIDKWQYTLQSDQTICK